MEHVDVVLIYPQRAPRRGRHWIMPSLGLAYLSSALRNAGYSVRQIDHTFLERDEVLAEVERLKPAVIGIYCMVTMQDEAFSLARDLRGKALLVVGGPYPSGEQEPFLDDFDLVGVGEGEETIVEIMRAPRRQAMGGDQGPRLQDPLGRGRQDRAAGAQQGHERARAALSRRPPERRVHHLLAASTGRTRPLP